MTGGQIKGAVVRQGSTVGLVLEEFSSGTNSNTHHIFKSSHKSSCQTSLIQFLSIAKIYYFVDYLEEQKKEITRTMEHTMDSKFLSLK